MGKASEQRPNKKLKTSPPANEDDENRNDLESLADLAWNTYREYLESTNDEENPEGEIDALEEFLQDFAPKIEARCEEEDKQAPTTKKDDKKKKKTRDIADNNHSSDVNDDNWTSVLSRLKILVSVGYYHLAEHFMSQWLALVENNGAIATKSTKTEKEAEEENYRTVIQQYIQQSLLFFPWNACTLSMGANFGRISQLLSLPQVCQWYEQAIVSATRVRSMALNLLDSDLVDRTAKEWIELLLLDQISAVEYLMDDNGDGDGDGDGDDEMDGNTDDEENNDGTINETSKELSEEENEDEKEEKDMEENEEDDEEGTFSASMVEATSRFMAATIYSTLGKHDLAHRHLQRFPVTHRLHPNVWGDNYGSTTTKVNGSNKNKNNISSSAKMQPVSFSKPGGIIPDHLYKRMCDLFTPEAMYWKESDYSNSGYYSYYMDIEKDTNDIACENSSIKKGGKGKKGGEVKEEKQSHDNNLIREVIVNHLLPMAEKVLKDNRGEKICGAEWWVHTRPTRNSNLGHNMHFDTDEVLLAQSGEITHPVLSSVLYLTGGGNENAATSGATIVLNQTPDSKHVADKVWKSTPRDNTYMIFPGNLLHGVLPCPGGKEENKNNSDNGYKDTIPSDNGNGQQTHIQNTNQRVKELLLQFTKEGGINKKKPKSSVKKKPKKEQEINRLTFMVGWWTRRVPDKMNVRKLYGPCGPLPPQTPEHSWVQEIHKGYSSSSSNNNKSSTRRSSSPKKPNLTSDISMVPLPVVAPAWEIMDSVEKTNTNGENNNDDNDTKNNKNQSADQEPLLELPTGINHRFFVNGAPQCFRQSLFERDENDEDYCEEQTDE